MCLRNGILMYLAQKFIFVSLEPRQDDIQEARIIMYKKLINFINIYLKGLY